MNADSPTPTPKPQATPTPETPQPEGPKESIDAVMDAFKACSESLAKLHVNDVRKVLNGISVVYFGR